ncbi:MAG: class I SAM-dependent methyltransferase [Desmonostoc geniculatum HA4340-LM1]|nr:class I SAM-dependent methyltransferase [Goleter apudmare HA4340-LM2]MBW4678302.1 class I SAM-dependent methyltransferase [Desmonostoc geniculatum HA4340-LM1]
MTSKTPVSTVKLTGVLETLMITLYARAIETRRSSPIIQDSKAVEIAEQVDYKFDKYSQGWTSQLGCSIRAKEYDSIVQNFIQNHPNSIIVNLGAGLCTRFTRVDNGKVYWYEVDFPDVIELRYKFFEESERYKFIPQSILDFTWIDQIQRSPNQPLMVILEGVTMYLTEADNREIIKQIHTRLAPAEVVFDVLNHKSAQSTKGHDTVSKTSAEFQWGIDNSTDLETWETGITLKDEVFYLTQFANHRDRLPFWVRPIAFILTPIFKNTARIVRLQVNAA